MREAHSPEMFPNAGTGYSWELLAGDVFPLRWPGGVQGTLKKSTIYCLLFLPEDLDSTLEFTLSLHNIFTEKRLLLACRCARSQPGKVEEQEAPLKRMSTKAPLGGREGSMSIHFHAWASPFAPHCALIGPGEGSSWLASVKFSFNFLKPCEPHLPVFLKVL